MRTPESIGSASANWVTRMFAAAGAIVLGLLAISAFAALAVGAVALALGGLVRLWWLRRKSVPSRPVGIVVEYTVENEPTDAA